MRANERKNNELRSVEFIPHYIINPEGAVLVSFGNTKVICTATIEHKLPPFMRGQGKVGLQLNIQCYHAQLIHVIFVKQHAEK